jgi:hypothetical protein
MNEEIPYPNDPNQLGFLTDPVFYYGLVTGIAVAALLLFFWWLSRRQPDVIAAFDNQNGKVTVSRKALQELIQGCCERVSDVGRARATVTTRGGVINTHVRLRLNANGKLDSISGYLQEQISGAFKQNLGIESIGNIDIVVIGILPEPVGKENEGQSKL